MIVYSDNMAKSKLQLRLEKDKANRNPYQYGTSTSGEIQQDPYADQEFMGETMTGLESDEEIMEKYKAEQALIQSDPEAAETYDGEFDSEQLENEDPGHYDLHWPKSSSTTASGGYGKKRVGEQSRKQMNQTGSRTSSLLTGRK